MKTENNLHPIFQGILTSVFPKPQKKACFCCEEGEGIEKGLSKCCGADHDSEFETYCSWCKKPATFRDECPVCKKKIQ